LDAFDKVPEKPKKMNVAPELDLKAKKLKAKAKAKKA
jgi:hypothetical protein